MPATGAISPVESVQAIGIANRKRTKDEIVKEREQRCVQSQTERNGPHYRQYKQGIAAESPQRVLDIAERGLNQLRAADGPAFFLHRIEPAESNASQPRCLCICSARFRVLPGLHLEVELQLLVKFPVDASLQQKRPNSKL